MFVSLKYYLFTYWESEKLKKSDLQILILNTFLKKNTQYNHKGNISSFSYIFSLGNP